MLTLDRVLPWLLRGAWVAVLVLGGSAIDVATEARAAALSGTVTWSAFAIWFVGLSAMAVPSVVGLTATRLIVPLAVPAAAVAVLNGAGDEPAGWGFLAASLLATVLAGSADFGRLSVQASAYGEEDRHLLRAPAAYLFASVITWLVWATSVIAAPLLLGHGRWVLGTGAAAVAIAGGALGWPRWHRLTRRWFVVVPIGVVIHDHLVLAETVMLRRHELARIGLAPAGTEAADLTGPASGHAVEIVTNEPATVIYAATPHEPRGRAIHLTAALVAPTRPGQALTAAARRRLPVG